MIDKNKLIDNRYKIIRIIGEGGMCVVYLADDIILKRKVAIKILHFSLSKSNKFIERFKREAKAVTSLVHPNIVEVYDMGVCGEIYFIVMEYLEGLTLKDYLKKNNRISINKIIDITIEICEGLKIAHKKNIYHRDLKPQNIFITNDKNIKIVDFGIAFHQDATPLTQTNAVMGSVHYLSPEQARGENATIQTDIYSLGIVIYEMLTKEVPFKGDSAVNIVLKHIREPLPYPKKIRDDIPQSMENIVLKCTAKQKQDRYKNLNEIIYDLKHVYDKDRLNEARIYFEHSNFTSQNKEDIDDDDTINNLNIKESIVDVKNKKFYKKKNFKIIFSIIILLLCFVFSWLYYDIVSTTYIPDLKNHTLEQAKSKLLKNELSLGIVEHEGSNEIEEGRIISTDIPFNTKVKKNTLVNIKISKGKILKMIDLVNKTEEEAINLCSAQKVNYKIQYESPKNNIKEGIVLKQSKDPGEDINLLNDVIVLLVSRKNRIELADLKGRTKQEVLKYASEHNINVNIEYEYNSDIAEGIVINMLDFWPGKKIKEGEAFSLLISKGKNPNQSLPPSSPQGDPLIPSPQPTPPSVPNINQHEKPQSI